MDNVTIIMTKDQATFLLGLVDWENNIHPLPDEEADVMDILKRAIEKSSPNDPPESTGSKSGEEGEVRKCLKCSAKMIEAYTEIGNNLGVKWTHCTVCDYEAFIEDADVTSEDV